jgi:hypothetical protein
MDTINAQVFSANAVWALLTTLNVVTEENGQYKLMRSIGDIDASRVYSKQDLITRLYTHFNQVAGKGVAA